MTGLALLLALASAPPPPGVPVYAGVATGGGYDSTLARLPGGSSGSGAGSPLQGSSFATARLWLGYAAEPLAGGEAALEIGYRGTFHRPALADLTEHRPWLSAGWLHPLGEDLALRFSGFGAWRATGDPARSGWDAGGNAALRWRPARWLALRISGGFTHRDASDPAYAWDSVRAGAGAELGLWRGAFAVLSWALDGGRDTFHEGEVAVSGERLGHTLSLELNQDLPAGLFLSAGYAFAAVQGELRRYQAQAAFAEVGWRLD